MKKSISIVLSMVLVAAFVYAALTLVYEQEVSQCFDTDAGLNFSKKGTIYAVDLNNTNQTYTDNCKSNNITLREGACSVVNGTVYAQVWTFDCSDINMTCSSGKCV